MVKYTNTHAIPEDYRAIGSKCFNWSTFSDTTTRRTACSKVYSMGEGKYQAVLFPEAVHYQNKDTGQWEEIDNTLSESIDSSGTPSLSNTLNAPSTAATS